MMGRYTAAYRPAMCSALFWMICLLGCADRGLINPAFPLPIADARADLRRMKREPVELERPVIVIGGYLDPGLAAAHVAGRLRELTGDPRVHSFATLGSDDFDDARRRFFEWLRATLPDEAGGEFDVVGISMGGLLARYAASGLADITATDERPSAHAAEPLRIVRLFTIATPHRGASLADDSAMHVLQRQMHIGSEFLDRLNGHSPAAYEIIPYVRLKDAIVGVENAAPPGVGPWWVPNRPFQASHTQAFADPRILADIARRLRRESPFTMVLRTPLRGESH